MLGVAVALAVAIGVVQADSAAPMINPRRVVNRVVVIVDEMVFTLRDLDRQIPDAERRVSPEELTAKRKALAEELVEKALIAGESQRRQVTADDDDIKGALDAVAAQNNMTVADVFKAAAEQGFDEAAYRGELRRQLIAIRTIQQWTREDIGRSDNPNATPDYEAGRMKMLGVLRKRAYVEVRL